MWSIGIYLGETPLQLGEPPGVANPVLTRESVSDIPAGFVADPFMTRTGGLWHMFFEVLNHNSGRGEIALATSENGLQWTYQQVVLVEPFHLSYPNIFEWNGRHYMVPETLNAGGVNLYAADEFPTRWSHVGQLFAATCADPSIFRFRNRWWMFACSTPYQHDTLRLYYAEDLLGRWREHPASPIVAGDKQRARPGGRVLVQGHSVIRFAQDCVPRYGTRLRSFEITELTLTAYHEKEIASGPFEFATGNEWNALGMHHIDAHPLPDGRWIACADGRNSDGDPR